MEDVIIYYLRDGHHTEEHRKRISLAMKSHYAANPMTAEHKRKISEGMKIPRVKERSLRKHCQIPLAYERKESISFPGLDQEFLCHSCVC